jgi:hypothetical protein
MRQCINFIDIGAFYINDTVIADNLFIQTPKGTRIPLYFNNPNYFWINQSDAPLNMNDDNFIKACQSIIKDKPQAEIETSFECYSIKKYDNNESENEYSPYYITEISSLSDWYKSDLIKIPIDSPKDLESLILTNKENGTDKGCGQSLASLLYKYNMVGKYLDYESRYDLTSTDREYPFCILQQYKVNNKSFVTIIRFTLTKTIDKDEYNIFRIIGWTCENANDIQQLLYSKLRDYTPITFLE